MHSGLYNSHFALLTLHGKEKLIAPLLHQHFNASLTLTTAFDTDTLGTFSGEVNRQLTAEECALKKATMACELTGLALGLGSEGSFGPSPYGFGVLNHEMVACINREKNWAVVGHYTGFSNARTITSDNVEVLYEFIENTPDDQALVIKSSAHIEKALYGLQSIQQILLAWFGAFERSDTLPEAIMVSYDLRAHHCPERRIHITKACENLIDRLKMTCPKCKTPGFWPDERVPGLPCVSCGTPTDCTKATVSTCRSCRHRQMTLVEMTSAEQDYCPYCNP